MKFIGGWEWNQKMEEIRKSGLGGLDAFSKSKDQGVKKSAYK